MRVNLSRVGETENEGNKWRGNAGGQRHRHNKVVAAKPLDKLHTGYERKVRQVKKREEGADGESSKSIPTQGRKSKAGGRYGGKTFGKVKTELKTTEQIRKGRKIVEKRRMKNARPTHGSKRGRR